MEGSTSRIKERGLSFSALEFEGPQWHVPTEAQMEKGVSATHVKQRVGGLTQNIVYLKIKGNQFFISMVEICTCTEKIITNKKL